MHEKCGVVGIALRDREVARPLYYSLYALQHRGQEAAGIATHDGFQQYDHTDTGLVGDAFDEADIDDLTGTRGVGHVRYPTSGGVGTCCAQPFSVSFKSGSLAVSHNGNLVNTEALRDTLAEDGHTFTTDADTEVITHELARNLLSAAPIQAIAETMEQIHGSYSLTVLHDETVYGIRDPKGNRPLVLGELDDGYVLASESAAVETLDGEVIRDVAPGEVIRLATDGTEYTSHQLATAESAAHCFFEYVYFARPDSVIDGRRVYEVRRDLGARLWEQSGIDTDVVMPVPDSGRAFAAGYAGAAQDEGADVEFAEGLMKNRYVGRTFIMPTQEQRERAVRLKLNPIKHTVAGRSVTIVDDSIVRGTTSHQLVDIVRDAGAEAVHIRIGAPPIAAPCYLGIDMPTREELIAADMSVDEIEDAIGADSLAYLTAADIARVLDFDSTELCLGCVSGAYPYDIEGEKSDRETLYPPVGVEDPPAEGD